MSVHGGVMRVHGGVMRAFEGHIDAQFASVFVSVFVSKNSYAHAKSLDT
jgi:hypothetical protein